MSLTELILMGLGLAADAFAASVCKGLSMHHLKHSNCFVIALFFGGFQALMPYIGYLLGNTFEKAISSVDHWIAFFLLCYIGGKMIYESYGNYYEDGKPTEFRLDIKELLILSVATSIDALAVGITFSFFENTNIIKNITVIGLTTFVVAYIGVITGNKFGTKYKKQAEWAGGAILVILGFKILLEGLSII